MSLSEIGFKNLKEIEKVQQKSLEMLKLFIDVCEKLNLKYYLIAGTLLGAVRHNGFIPWDDDVDVGMPREDYEKFLEKAQELLPENYFVQTCFTDPEFPANFAKIRNSNTTFIETSVKNCKINHGVYIDIFPLDWNAPSGKDLKKFNFKNFYYKMAIAKKFYVKGFVRKLKLIAVNVITLFTPSSKALKKRDNLLKSNKKSKYLANYCGAWGVKEITPAEWYGEGIEMEFEGIKAIVPSNYKAWLTQVYGNYMQLPPIEKRVTHHFTEVIDLDKSYKEYTKGE